MSDSFLYFFPRMGNKGGGGGLSNFKSTFTRAMPFFFFHGRGNNYLLYLLMDFASPPTPLPLGIKNEWFLRQCHRNFPQFERVEFKLWGVTKRSMIATLRYCLHTHDNTTGPRAYLINEYHQCH